MSSSEGPGPPGEEPASAPSQPDEATARPNAGDSQWVPPTDRELLEKVLYRLQGLEDDLQTIRFRTGCLFAWLVLILVLGAFALLGGLGH